MSAQVSACGVVCSSAPCFNTMCAGCNEVDGKPFWVKEHIPEGICPIYDCAKNQKGYATCGECESLPCEMYYSLKDPSMSDEEHLAGIKKRTETLKNLK